MADACRAAELLAREGIQARVLDMFTIKPIDRNEIIRASQETGAVITIENHNILNGLGSAVAEVLAEEAPCRMIRMGVQDRFGEVGTLTYLKQLFHMTPEDIAANARRLVARKSEL